MKNNKFCIPFSYIVTLLIVFRIILYIYFVVNGAEVLHPDTGLYLELASQLIKTGEFFLPAYTPYEIEPFGVLSKDTMRVLASSLPLGPEIFRTPGYPAFLVLLHWFGINDPYAIVFIQELIYGLSVYIFYRYGRQLFNKNLVQAVVIYMLIGVGGIIWPKFLIAESLFFLFVLVGILSIGLYLKNTDKRFLIIAGLSMGIGAWVRPGIQFFPLVAAVTIILFDIKNRKKWLHSGTMLLVFILVISPWLMRNYYHYRQIFMSGQVSNLLAYYHVPTLMTYKKNTTTHEGRAIVRKAVEKIVEQKERQIGRPLDAVEILKLQQNWALKEISHDLVFYFKHWLIAAGKNMYEPFTIDLYYALRITDERPHLFAILSGDSGLVQGLIYYFQHQDMFYLFVTVFSFLVFIFALVGALVIVKKRNCFLWIMMLANFYFVFIPGPEVFGRFRFPVDNFIFLQACLGFIVTFEILKSFFLKRKTTK